MKKKLFNLGALATCMVLFVSGCAPGSKSNDILLSCLNEDETPGRKMFEDVEEVQILVKLNENTIVKRDKRFSWDNKWRTTEYKNEETEGGTTGYESYSWERKKYQSIDKKTIKFGEELKEYPYNGSTWVKESSFTINRRNGKFTGVVERTFIPSARMRKFPDEIPTFYDKKPGKKVIQRTCTKKRIS